MLMDETPRLAWTDLVAILEKCCINLSNVAAKKYKYIVEREA